LNPAGFSPSGLARSLAIPAAIILAAGQAMPLRAQEAAPAAPAPAAPAQPAAQPAVQPAAQNPGTTARLGFNFKDAPWDQVLDYFARQTGLPVINEAAPPQAPVTFISAADYTLDDALDIVNRMLWMHGLQLRREPTVLMLSKLEDAKARSRQFVGQLPEAVGQSEVVTLVLPLNFALASQVAEKLNAAGLIGKGGALVPLPQQNSLVLVDTAAQVRRIKEIVAGLDNKPAADAQIKLFALTYAEAPVIFNAIKALVAEKRQTIIIDKDGQQRRVNDEVFEGLTLQPDPRTNSLLAVGTPAKLKTVEEIIKLLDRPEGAAAGGREMTTFAMGSVSPDEAVQKINALFAPTPEKQRPTLVSMPAQGKLAVIGTPEQSRQAAALLAELDPGSAPSSTTPAGARPQPPVAESRAAVVPLRHLRADAALTILGRLLTPRQSAAMRLAAMPDQKGLILSGPAFDVQNVRDLLSGLDQPGQGEREVRIVRIGTGDVASAVDRAKDLYTKTGRAEREPVEATIDHDTRTVALAGARPAITTFAELLTSVQQGARVERETAMLPVRRYRPSDLAARMARLVRPMLEPADGADYVPPAIEPVDELSTLVVRATPNQIATLTDLVTRLDADAFGATDDALGPVELRTFRLRQAAPGAVASAIRTLIAAGGGGVPVSMQSAVNIATDDQSRMLIVTGPATVFPAIEKVLAELDMQSPGSVVVKAVRVHNARAERIAPLVQSLMERDPNSFRQDTPVIPAGGARPPAAPARAGAGARTPAAPGGNADSAPIRDPLRVVAEPRTNALVLTGPIELIGVAEKVIAELDADAGDLAPGGAGAARPFRVISLVTADAADALAAVQALFADDPAATPPTLRVDKAANALLVRATPAQLAAIEEVVAKLDQATASASRDMRMVPIDRSRADAAAMADVLRRLLSQRQGVKVEVISAEELIKRTAPAAPADKPQPAAAEPKKGAFRPSETPFGPGAHPLTTILTVAQLAVAEPAPAPAPESVGAAAGEAAAQPPAAPADPTAGVTIAVDPVTNALIVVGPPKLTQRVADLAAQLQAQMPPEPSTLRIVQLPPGTDARALSATLVGLATQLGQSSPQNPSGFSGRPSIQPDPDGDALIISANDADFRVVAELVAALATPKGTAGVTVKVYPLVNTPAQAVLRAAADLFSPTPQGQQARRVRQLDLTLGENGERAVIDPALLRFSADPSGSALIVAAPPAALPILDRFIAMLDQSPTQAAGRASIRVVPLKNARASDAARTLQSAFDAARAALPPGAPPLPRAQFSADDRTNTVVATATDAQLRQLDALLPDIDRAVADADTKVAIIPLAVARPSAVARIVDAVLTGRDPGRKDRLSISAADDASVFVVRGTAEQIEEVRALVAQVDKTETLGLPVRTLKLERADAVAVAQAVRQFFEDRARVSAKTGQRTGGAKVSIAGDRRSGTIVFAAGEEDEAHLRALLATLDGPATTKQYAFRLIPLENARLGDVRSMMDSLLNQVRFDMFAMARRGGAGDQSPPGAMVVEFDERANAVVFMGSDEQFETVERIVRALDVAPKPGSTLAVKAVRLQRADPRVVASAISSAMDPGRKSGGRWGGSVDWANAVRVEVDAKNRTLVMVGRDEQLEQASGYAAELDRAAGENQTIETIPLKFAAANRVAESLDRFFRTRQGERGGEGSPVSLIGSPEGNVLVAAAAPADLEVLRQLVAQIDQPDEGPGRSRELFRLKNADAAEIAATLREQFPAALASREGVVIVTPQASTQSVLVSAPAELAERLRALVAELDGPPTGDTRIVTVTLATARADDVAASLASALPRTVKVKVTPVRRTNALLITGSSEAIDLVMAQVKALDTQPVKSPVEFRRLRVEHARAQDIAQALRQVASSFTLTPQEPEPVVSASAGDNTVMITAAGDRLEQLRALLAQMDVPSPVARTTEFVQLRFADAEQAATALSVFFGRSAPEAASPSARSVTVVANPAGRSLIVSAEKDAWPGVRALIEKLDSETFDPSRRFEVLPLRHADAVSLARSLSEAFSAFGNAQAQADRDRRNDFSRLFRRDDAVVIPKPAADPRDTVSITAEPLTNALIISATKDQADRVKALAAQLDTPESAKLPDAHIIPLRIGPASQIASALRQAYTDAQAARNQNTPAGRAAAARAVVIIGEDKSNTLIVRAEEEAFAQIKAMAETLQQEGDRSKATVRVLTLKNVPAVRLAATLRATFADVAKSAGETLAIEVDRTANALVIASSEKLFEQLKRTVAELDALPTLQGAPQGPAGQLVPGLGQSVQIADVENNAPADLQRTLEAMGVTRPAPADRPGLVAEPVTIVPLATRRALALVGNPADNAAVASLIRALDSAPLFAEQHAAFIRLKNASAQSVSTALEQLLKPGEQDAQTPPARAIAEQVRRLAVHKGAAAIPGLPPPPPLSLDLTKPIRIYPDPALNAIVVASTKENVAALEELAATLDTLPLGPSVVVRLFPLETAAAQRLAATVRDLFLQADRLNTQRIAGSPLRTEPANASGKALASPIAITVDDRTNTLIVAGPEESVALVEVLVKQLDGARTAGWIEPVVLPLRHADARRLATTLRQVFVEGLKESPEAAALQRAAGRISIAISSKDAPAANADPAAAARIQADLFATLSSIVVVPQPELNALVLVGSTNNIAAMKELVKLLDVPAAAAGNSVRLYTLQFAAAERVAGLVRELFRQQLAAGAIKPEDDAVVTTDLRTNSLVVSTSPRSFAVIESLLTKLDGEAASPSVGLHVLPVPQGNAATLAPRIDQLMRERIEAQARSAGVTQPREVFSVVAEPQTSSLIVAASKENLEVVRQLIDVLAKGAQALDASRVVDVVAVRSARVETIAATVRELYSDKENRVRGQDSVKVTADTRLNSIVVSGLPKDAEAVRALVARLDGAPVTAVTEIKRIELKKTDATEAVRLLQSVLAGRALAGGAAVGQRQALLLRFLRAGRDDPAGEAERGPAPDEAEISGAVQEQVTITAEPRTNSIYVVAPAQVMVLVESLVADLDGANAGAREIEVFELKNADARQMSGVLRELFSLRQQGNTLTLVPGGSPVRDPREERPVVPGGADTPAALDPGFGGTFFPTVDERQQLAITVDVRTNSLIVSGTKEYLDEVRKVVVRLDAKEVNEREQLTVRLKNAKATDVAKTLQDYFREESDRVRTLLGPDRVGSLATQLEREVTVTGDEKSGSLIVSVSPRYREVVSRIITELDATPPQVLIQVLLAEVTLDQSSQFGIEARVGPLGGDLVRGQFLGAGNTVSSALGVPNFSVSSVDFELLVRALEAQGRLEVLSRPQITVRNNEPGKFQVGENIGIPGAFDQFTGGNTRTDVKREDVGILLSVTPQVNDDGFIRLDIEPEISALTTRTTQINEQVNAPVITKRNVKTIVTVKDGETVVLGGLIQDMEEVRRTKVPGLGDIPLVGELFKSSKYSKTKTELLVLVTPRVIRSGQAGAAELLRDLTDEEINRLSDPSRVRSAVPGPIPENDTQDPALLPPIPAPPPAPEQSPQPTPQP
jgi:type II secretion system protein D